MLLGEVKVCAKKPRSTAVDNKATGAGCLALVVAVIYLPKTVANSVPFYVRSRQCARACSHCEHRSHTAHGANASQVHNPAVEPRPPIETTRSAGR